MNYNLVDADGLEFFFDTIYQKYLQYIGTCVQQVAGKGLSTNDYTTAEKDKLAGIDTGAQVNVIESVKVNGSALNISGKAVDITVPTNYLTSSDISDMATQTWVGQLGYLTQHQSLNGYATETWVSDKLNDILGINANAVSTLISVLSDNDTQTGILNMIAGKVDSSSLATVATSGSYNDLINTPNLFSGSYNDLTNKPTLFSGSYDDLTNKPTIPSAYTLPTAAADTLGGIKVGSGLSIDANGVLSSAASYNNATTSTDGLMSSTDKTKLDGIASGATAVTESTVSGWGFTKNTGSLTSHQTITLASGTNNGTLKITTAAGTTDNIAVKGLGSLAYSSATIPTKVSDLTNDSGFTTNTGTITKVGNTSSGAVTVSSSNNTAGWGNAVTVGSVGGVDLKFTMPSNPNTTPVTSVAGNTGAVTAALIATALTSAGYKLTDNNTTYSAGTALTLSGTTFSMSSANVSTALNLLSTGDSAPTDADYYIAQYAGGGTSTTTYHRRPVSKLYNYIKGKLDSVYQPKGSYLTSHQDISGKQNKIPTSTASTTGTVNLACDTMYNIGTLTGNITFNLTAAPSDGYMHEWMFSFDVGSTAYTVTMPSGVTFPSSVSIAANKHYEVNIKGTYGLIASW